MIVLSLDMALCISLICIEKKCTQMPLAQCITHTLFKITLYNIIQHFNLTVAQHYLHTVMVTHGTHEVAQLHRHI